MINQVFVFLLKICIQHNKFFDCRVNKEEFGNHKPIPPQSDNEIDPDSDLPVTESILYDFLRKISNDNERLMYIYIFTALILATVLVTLIRSFIFFTVSFTHLIWILLIFFF